MAYEVQLPQIPAGIFQNPSQNIFPQSSINAPAGAALANSQNQGRVNQVLDILSEQNAMAGPLNQQAFEAQAINSILEHGKGIIKDRSANPIDLLSQIGSALPGGFTFQTGPQQGRLDEAFVGGAEADVQKTLSEAAENYASAAAAGRSGSGDSQFGDIRFQRQNITEGGDIDTFTWDGTPEQFEAARQAGIVPQDAQITGTTEGGQLTGEIPSPDSPVTEQPGPTNQRAQELDQLNRAYEGMEGVELVQPFQVDNAGNMVGTVRFAGRMYKVGRAPDGTPIKEELQ